MLKRTTWQTAVILGFVALALNACTVTTVDGDHPLLRPKSDGLAAKVYFIRPRTERYNGAADNRIRVDVGRNHLMDMGKGEYTLLRLLPGKVSVKVFSDTTWGPKHEFDTRVHSREFDLKPAETQYIVMTYVDGEFRGAYYKPEMIDAKEASALIKGSVPVGADTEAEPILPPEF
ncbi:MAG: hypothetical protein GC138_01630 [Gammaproteobacteria bacterium]|nr:hypothetical protein [Gammaproteobacteria bacterium]